MPNYQKGERIVLRSSQFSRRYTPVFAACQIKLVPRRIEQRRLIAGQQVEVVQPRCGGRLEDIAIDQMVRPVDQHLAGVRSVPRIVAALVQTVLVALGGQPLAAIAHATLHLADWCWRWWRQLLPVRDEVQSEQSDGDGQAEQDAPSIGEDTDSQATHVNGSIVDRCIERAFDVLAVL